MLYVSNNLKMRYLKMVQDSQASEKLREDIEEFSSEVRYLNVDIGLDLVEQKGKASGGVELSKLLTVL